MVMPTKGVWTFFLWLLFWKRSGRIYPSPFWDKNKVCAWKEKLSGWKNEPQYAVYLFICFHIRQAFHTDINLTTLISGWAWNMRVEMRERGRGGEGKEENVWKKKRKKWEGKRKSVCAWLAHQVNAVDCPRKKCHISSLLKDPHHPVITKDSEQMILKTFPSSSRTVLRTVMDGSSYISTWASFGTARLQTKALGLMHSKTSNWK